MGLLRSVQEDVLHRLGRVGVAARHAVESLLAGQHRSIHRGLSVEFAGHRPYQLGDDLRHLDWRVYARTDRYDIKVFEEETRLRAHIVVDYSGSMAYGEGTTKLEYARMLAAALAFLMVRQGDAVGLVQCDSTVRSMVPPVSTMGHLLTLLEHLESEQAGGDTALGTVIDDIAERIQRRGLVIVITDAFDDPERLVRSLRHLRHRKQDVRLFQIIDRAECDFPFSGAYDFIGMEHEPRLRVDGDRARRLYQQQLESHHQTVAAGCHAAGIQVERIATDEDLALSLVRALTRAAPAAGGRR
ncbi:MAG: DUF58 domain-containing protein [Planctomycetota bacterium]|jgi:uncharacterized protein (DUF58 family)|nr:DUF58 domain-containing protein [Planctomycetota bacterium]